VSNYRLYTKDTSYTLHRFLDGLEILSFDVLVVDSEGVIHDLHKYHLKNYLPVRD
jgi:hypothetical protein